MLKIQGGVLAEARGKILEFCPGAVIDNRYEVISLLGMGAIGKVYKVRHSVLGTVYAIKFIVPEAINEAALKRFKLEAQAVSVLKHTNIIGIHDYGVAGEMPYIVMEYLEGKTLSQSLQEDGCPGRTLFFSIFEQVCSGLEHAHKQGILHRDLKPANIFLCVSEKANEPTVKIVDFGFAKVLTEQAEASRITLTGEVVGSPFYMSPEQCMGDELDTRSDIYSLGIVMFEALTGEPPFGGKNPVEIMQQHIHAAAKFPPDAGVTESLQNLVLKTIAKDRKKRPQTAEDLRQKLLALRQEEEKVSAEYKMLGSDPSAPASNRFQVSRSSTDTSLVSLLKNPKLIIGAAIAFAALICFFLTKH